MDGMIDMAKIELTYYHFDQYCFVCKSINVDATLEIYLHKFAID